MMTDNSERLRENLEMLKKSKLLREMKKQQKVDDHYGDPRRKYRAVPIKKE